MLPKFLIADNSIDSPGKLYVIHNEHPRFIMEGDDEDFTQNQLIHWIDDEVTDEEVLETLRAKAEDFLDEELDNQEELYDVSMN